MNYTPGAYSGVGDKKNVVEQNAIFDKAGVFYFSRASLSIYGDPENVAVSDEIAEKIGEEKASGARKNRHSWGIFFDFMHDEVKINPVDIKYFEDGGIVHFYTAALGLSYKIITQNNFFSEYGFGITQTSMFGSSFEERSNAERTDWFLKIGVGYRMNLTNTSFINLGIDLTAIPFNSYIKMNDGNFKRFEHVGIYPYVGIGF